MLVWLSENWGTLLISAVLVVIVALVIWSLVRGKRQGKSSCGGNCAGCAGCAACRPVTPKKR